MQRRELLAAEYADAIEQGAETDLPFVAMPIAVLEALTAGTPVAAYGVGGIPDAVTRVGGGTIVPAGSTAALAGALEKELNGGRSRRELAQRADVFALDRAVAPIREIYEELLDV